MTFARLRTADWLAMVAALALLMIMATDWYSTVEGDQARKIENNTPGNAPGEAGQDLRDYKNQARIVAESQERNAWQEKGLIDRVILITLLAAIALAIASGFLRAAGKRFEPPLTPSSLAAIAAGVGALLLTYRIVQEPGIDSFSTIKAGAPLAVAALGILTFAGSRGLKHEEEGEPFRPLPEPTPPEPAPE
ncbi:MAG: hypothetical protein ACJ766_01145 [Thermoleophilaceae bacterium]